MNMPLLQETTGAAPHGTPSAFPYGPAPFSIEAEQAVLGALLLDNGALETLPDNLNAADFHDPVHGRLYEAIKKMIQHGSLAEPVGVEQRMRADAGLHELGGLSYLANLVCYAPPVPVAAEHAALIKSLATKRALISLAATIDLEARTRSDIDGNAQLETAEQYLFNLADRNDRQTGFRPFQSALTGAMQMAIAATETEGGISGLRTGLADLDEKLGGLHPSDLIIIAGRPSMGKTSLATGIAYHVARNYQYDLATSGNKKTLTGGVVGFFSLEMSSEQLALRLLSEASGVSSDRLRKGEIRRDELSKVRDAAIEIDNIPLFIDDTGAISIAKLAARARRLKRTSGLDLIIVDYLQLVSSTETSRTEGRVAQVAEITKGLKALAKDLRVPVIALSQLSRQVETREDKRPMLADLRESGAIEQDADVVLFVYRDAYYKQRAEPEPGTKQHADWCDELDSVRNIAELIIGKQRHGPIGTVRVAFTEELTRFSNLRSRGRHLIG